MREFIYEPIQTWIQELHDTYMYGFDSIDIFEQFLEPLPIVVQYQLLSRVFEEAHMSGAFTGQSSDIPCFFAQEEWQEIDRLYAISDEDLLPYLQLAIEQKILSNRWL